ncbi:MAG: A/G-specific adenine glycosylase [Myxococcota bacterium]
MIEPDPLRASLRAWYLRQKRALPWRDAPTPYRVWVSEIMLQQTQVATVLPYFERFVTAFPSVERLAAADESEVMTLWSGLGYYRRARMLHAAAKVVAAEHGGQLPASVDGLAALPGIGRYTAGAIASIAFGIRAPVLDGNVARVLSRLVALPDHIDGGPGQKALWALAEALVPSDDPSTHNQAMMELGALVCTPKSPACGSCPWAGACAAHAAGSELDYPSKKPRAAPKAVFAVAGYLPEGLAGDRVLLARRPPMGCSAACGSCRGRARQRAHAAQGEPRHHVPRAARPRRRGRRPRRVGRAPVHPSLAEPRGLSRARPRPGSASVRERRRRRPRRPGTPRRAGSRRRPTATRSTLDAHAQGARRGAPMRHLKELALPLGSSPADLARRAEALGVRPDEVIDVRVTKVSVDARDKQPKKVYRRRRAARRRRRAAAARAEAAAPGPRRRRPTGRLAHHRRHRPGRPLGRAAPHRGGRRAHPPRPRRRAAPAPRGRAQPAPRRRARPGVEPLLRRRRRQAPTPTASSTRAAAAGDPRI